VSPPGRPRVALIGANGHGLWHRRQLAERTNRLALVALSDPAPVTEAEGAAVPAGAAVFTDHRAMLAAARPDVVVICTPPHTHLAIATDALRAGCDILLEKPPVLSRAEDAALAGVAAETGRAVQVGFQALGSRALTLLVDAVAAGAIGDVRGVAAVAAWQRPDTYYRRAAWAGRRSVGGRPVLDGALVNPLAHAVLQAIVVAQAAGTQPTAEVVRAEIERYRTRPIEVDDTACLRVTLRNVPPVLVAVTLCGEDFIRGEIIVYGSRGQAVLEYPTDRLQLPGDAEPVEVPGRVSLLDNLLDHRTDPGVALIAPLERTRPFTVLVEAITEAPEPSDVDPACVVVTERDGQTHRTIAGINDVLRRSADRQQLFIESGVEWARTAPHQWTGEPLQTGAPTGA
jgi:predicted dehydrogenase